jgi:hypothetical protein
MWRWLLIGVVVLIVLWIFPRHLVLLAPGTPERILVDVSLEGEASMVEHTVSEDERENEEQQENSEERLRQREQRQQREQQRGRAAKLGGRFFTQAERRSSLPRQLSVSSPDRLLHVDPGYPFPTTTPRVINAWIYVLILFKS